MDTSHFGIKVDDDLFSPEAFVKEQIETRKKLHQWQSEAIDYFFNNDCKAIFSVCTGCLSGDTKIRINRVGGCRTHTIKELFNLYNGNPEKIGRIHLGKFKPKIPSYVRSFDGNIIKLHKLKNVVYSGVKKVFELVLEDGKKIKATADHKIMTINGWKKLLDLNKEDKIMIDRPLAESQKRIRYKIRDIGIAAGYHPCDRKNKQISVHTLIYEAYLNNMEFLKYLDIIWNEKDCVEYLKFVPKGMHIHHKDGNHYNNIIDNLEMVSSEEHGYRYMDNVYQNFSQGIPKFSNVKNITYIGEEQTYDIICEEPYHNFVANDIIVHNSGKTYCAIMIIKEMWKKYPDMRILVIVPKNVILERTWYTELVDHGIPYYDIGIFYGKIKEYAKITLTNMQSMDLIDCERFDFCIYDELHNYGSERMMYYVKYGFKYKLGLSATFERMDNMHEHMIREFNYNIFKYMPMEALADKVLNDFDFTDIIVELDTNSRVEYEKVEQKINLIYAQFGGYKKCMMSTSASKFTLLKLLHERNKIVNNYPDKFEVIKKICFDKPDAKIIIFNQYNSQTNLCYWHLCDIGIKARVIHSGIHPKERNQVLDDFKNNIFNVLLTSKVLDEGYNLPQIDVGVMMAGDSTKKQTVQRMGRVLRKKQHKSELIQIYCEKTIEERNSVERGKLFKGLASSYKKLRYDKYNNQMVEEASI